MVKTTATGIAEMFLRVPPNLSKLLSRDAKKAESTRQAVVLAALAAHYGIEVAAPRRGRPIGGKS